MYLLPRLPYKYDAMNIEATAYALLVYTPRHNDEVTDDIVKWLNAQRLLDSGWASTQVIQNFCWVFPIFECSISSTS